MCGKILSSSRNIIFHAPVPHIGARLSSIQLSRHRQRVYTRLWSRVGADTESPARGTARERCTPALEDVLRCCQSDGRVHLPPEQPEPIDVEMGVLRREHKEAVSYERHAPERYPDQGRTTLLQKGQGLLKVSSTLRMVST